ncbi:MAG: hypothetical protein ACRD7E_06580 [Bryobacteraceae bacterium]
MRITVVGLFENRAAGETAVNDLVNSGFSRDAISIVAGDTRQAATDTPDVGPVEELTDRSAGKGAAIGGLAGFAAGIVAVAIPGIGPIIAAGPLASGLIGATVGVAAGGLIGGLKDMGIPEEHAKYYSDAVGRGNVLVSVIASEVTADHAADILEENGALEIEERAKPRVPVGTKRTASIDTAHRPDYSVREKQKARERRVRSYPEVSSVGPNTEL